MSFFLNSESICIKQVVILVEQVMTLQRENSSLREALAKGAARNFVSSLPISIQGDIKKLGTILATYFASVINATPGDTQTPTISRNGSLKNSDKKRLTPCPICGSRDCPLCEE